MAYLNRILNEPTPQSEPLPGMVPNSAGGHAYPVDDMTRLRRFLILGSEGGSYYADERKLTLENAAAVKRCIENDGTKAVYEIAYISRHGRAPKVGPRSSPSRWPQPTDTWEPGRWLSDTCRRWPGPAASSRCSLTTLEPCAAGDVASGGLSPTGTSTRTSRTLSTRRSSIASGTTGPTGTCLGRPTQRRQARKLTTCSPGSPRDNA